MGTLFNIAIGTVFVFVVFSLVVSGINELITAVFAIRSKILWQTLTGLAAATSENLPKLDLGRVLQLAATASWLKKTPVLGKLAQGWHDHRPLVLAAAPTGASGFLSGLAARTTRFDSAKVDRRTRVKNVSPQVVSQVLLELGGDLPTLGLGSTIAQGEAFIDRIARHDEVVGTHLEAPVRVAAARAQGDIERFRVAIEEWFDARMNALSGLYKTWSRWMMLGIAVVVAFVMSVNPIRTIDALRKDSALGQATADQAASFVANVTPTADLCPPGVTSSATPSTLTAADRVAQCYGAVRDAISRGRQLPPPLSFSSHALFKGTQTWFEYILGCGLGAVALSFGAPFWFDALRKLIALRR